MFSNICGKSICVGSSEENKIKSESVVQSQANLVSPTPQVSVVVCNNPSIISNNEQMDSPVASKTSVMTKSKINVFSNGESISDDSYSLIEVDGLVEELEDDYVSLIDGCPPGMEKLAMSSSISLQHCHSDILPTGPVYEVLTAVSIKDRYQLINQNGEKVYYAFVTSNCCRWALSGARPFEMFVIDEYGQVIFSITRPFQCSLFLWAGDCYGNKIIIRDSEGEILGIIKQKFRLFSPRYEILDVNLVPFLFIKGPPISLFPTGFRRFFPKFEVYKPRRRREREKVGTFIQCPYGMTNENLGNTLRIGFKTNCTVKTKAILVGALTLLYFMYYEENDIIPARTGTKNLPLSLLNPYHAANLRKSSGKMREKCNVCRTTVFFGGIVTIVLLLIWLLDDWQFDFVPDFTSYSSD